MKKTRIGLVGVAMTLVLSGCAFYSPNSRPALLGGDADLTLFQSRSAKNVSKVQDATNSTNGGGATSSPSGGGSITLDPTQLAGLIRASQVPGNVQAPVEMPRYQIPTPPPVYTVQKGDNLWDIAHRFDTTVQELRRLNGIRGDLIHPGQILTLP